MTYTQPLLLILAIISMAGLAQIRRCKRKLLVVIALAGFLLLSWPPIDWILSRPLEGRYPIRPVPVNPAPQAIVVLSSAVSPPLFERPFAVADYETFQRCQFAAWLHTRWPDVPVLASGGPIPGRSSYAAAMRKLLIGSGVPDQLVWTEERSSSTHENALYSSRILRDHGIHVVALVLEAVSMPRAEACFRKQGVAVLPTPSDFRELGPPWSEELLPSWKAIRRNETILHEALGLVWYRFHGWI